PIAVSLIISLRRARTSTKPKPVSASTPGNSYPRTSIDRSCGRISRRRGGWLTAQRPTDNPAKDPGAPSRGEGRNLVPVPGTLRVRPTAQSPFGLRPVRTLALCRPDRKAAPGPGCSMHDIKSRVVLAAGPEKIPNAGGNGLARHALARPG